MGFIEQQIARQVQEKLDALAKQLGDKFQPEFDKLGAELKGLIEYVNAQDKRIESLEKKVG